MKNERKTSIVSRVFEQPPKQNNPKIYGGYGYDLNEIIRLPRVAISPLEKMHFGTCMSAFVLPDGRTVEEWQGEYGQPRMYVFDSLDAYKSYIVPMPFNVYHE